MFGWLALLDHVLLLRKIHLESLDRGFQEEHSSNAGPDRADHLFWRGCALEGIADA